MSVKIVELPIAWKESSYEGVMSDEEKTRRADRREHQLRTAERDINEALNAGYDVKTSVLNETWQGRFLLMVLHKLDTPQAQAAR